MRYKVIFTRVGTAYVEAETITEAASQSEDLTSDQIYWDDDFPTQSIERRE